MTTKEKVLRMLDAGKDVSGETLARELGVSRNAVWKAMAQLREQGYGIEAVTNRGYRLVSAPDRLSREEIRHLTYLLSKMNDNIREILNGNKEG